MSTKRRYVCHSENLPKKVIADIGAADDSIHDNQRLSLFNGYYGQFMYNELFFQTNLSAGKSGKPLNRNGITVSCCEKPSVLSEKQELLYRKIENPV